MVGELLTPEDRAGRGRVERPDHGRIADIELLRGIAILFTLFEHIKFNLVTWPNAALDGILSYFHFSSGVDLFLAISGFVIARNLVPALINCGTQADYARVTLAFWVRRAWRLLPSAWLWLAVILVASACFNRSDAFGAFRTNFEATVSAVLNVANLRSIALYGAAPLGASSPYWSLSLEEQFYLLFPILIFVSRRWLPVVLGVFVLLQLFTVRTIFLMFIRTDALMLGVLIALWSRTDTYRLFDPRFLRDNRLVRAAFLLLLLVLLAALDVPNTTIIWFPVGLIALISAALVLVASFDRDYLMRDGPLKRLLLWFGSRSYALYIIHMPVMLGTRELWFRLGVPTTHGHGPLLVFTAFAVIGVVAELNFRLVETPLRRKGAAIADAILAGRTRVVEPVASPGLAHGEPAEEALEVVG
jgi:peptidoglycan/LPS O-acetylase OafA/YrhL